MQAPLYLTLVPHVVCFLVLLFVIFYLSDGLGCFFYCLRSVIYGKVCVLFWCPVGSVVPVYSRALKNVLFTCPAAVDPKWLIYLCSLRVSLIDLLYFPVSFFGESYGSSIFPCCQVVYIFPLISSFVCSSIFSQCLDFRCFCWLMPSCFFLC